MTAVTAERRGHAFGYGNSIRIVAALLLSSRSRHGDAVARSGTVPWGAGAQKTLKKRRGARSRTESWQDSGRRVQCVKTVTRLARTDTSKHLGFDMDTCM
jgi:hypothetical protein